MRVNLSDRDAAESRQRRGSFSPVTDLPASERLHLEGRVRTLRLAGHASFNKADFYDLFGPTKTGRKGYVRGRRPHRRTLIYDEPRRLTLEVDGSLSGNLDRLPDFQNIPVDVDRLDDARRRAQIQRHPQIARRRRRRVRHVVDGGGAGHRSSTATFVPRSRQLRSRIRAAGRSHRRSGFARRPGFSPNDRAQPFANFFFGGFGNNYVDRGNEKRYRETYSMPGAELNEIGGRNFVKSTIELNLPPLRFERARHAGVLRALAAAGGVRRRAWPPTSTIAPCAAHGYQRRRPGRLPASRCCRCSTDAVGRRRDRLRRRAPAAPRSDDLAEGPALDAPAHRARSRRSSSSAVLLVHGQLQAGDRPRSVWRCSTARSRRLAARRCTCWLMPASGSTVDVLALCRAGHRGDREGGCSSPC